MKSLVLLFVLYFVTSYETKKFSSLLSAHSLKVESIVLSNGFRQCTVVQDEPSIPHALLRSGNRRHIVEVRPLQIKEDVSFNGNNRFLEIFAVSRESAIEYLLSSECDELQYRRPLSNSQDIVFPLSISGDSANRVDVVFMGDGYTSDQQSLFLQDMKRMVTNMFLNQTYNTWLPLYNIWAVFRASAESGIGYYGAPKNTSYKLYRDGTELRGVYPGDPNAIQDSCTATGPNACDYPTCIGNDPFYGGLGGRFSISTSSVRSGTVVLRHEFGHSMGNVGEEYDSGEHFGANVARSLSIARDQWGPWVTETLQAEDSNDLVQDYSWFVLGNTSDPDYIVKFESEGTYDRWYLLFSMSGCEADGVISVTLDGVPLDWHSCDSLDRCFYGFYSDVPLDKGSHTLVWSQLVPPTSIFPRQLCSISMLEYKNEPLYHFNNSWVSAYPTYNEETKFRAYRSMNEHCLMRNMSSPEFCVADKQNLWLKLVGRVNLIDGVDVQEAPQNNINVTLHLIPFGQFRPIPFDGETYTSQWYLDNVLQTQLTNTFNWILPASKASGNWTVKVQLSTLDVRTDSNNVLSAIADFIVP